MKHVPRMLTEIVTHVINRSLENDVVPDKFKVARVLPIFQGNLTYLCLTTDKWSISVLPILSNIFERVL